MQDNLNIKRYYAQLGVDTGLLLMVITGRAALLVLGLAAGEAIEKETQR